MNILLIVASGKSSRFGGFPKAFCELGVITNVENTINKSKQVIDKVYIGVNSNTYNQFHDKIHGCEMFSIKTGQGDAHSLLKCMKHIKAYEEKVDNFLVCWGDAVFVSAKPFEELINVAGDAIVACARDAKPYAWFDIDDNNNIVKSHFAKEEGEVDEGLHDQSLFKFNLDYALSYLDIYRTHLGIPDNNDENQSDINEMKLLYSFEYLHEKGQPVKCFEITKNQVLAFNTQSELEEIKKKLSL